jgi:DNA-binding transcriptional MocR family regulator
VIELIHKYVAPGSAVKLAAGIEDLLRGGRVEANALLPPVRQLAARLQVSPGTAAAAYRVLRQRGLVATDRRRGTRALPPPRQREYSDPEAPRGDLDLRPANPDPALLPDLSLLLRGVRVAPTSYGQPHLDARLAALMRDDFEADDVPGDDLMATSGAVGALFRALRVVLAPGDKVAVEDPGFNEHHACVTALSLSPVPVALDEQGMTPESLEAALRSRARAVLVTARCQSPTGAAFGVRRAAALRAVLARFPEVAVLVDDYASLLADAPYRDCVGRARERWLVVRSFNKAMGPDLRVAIAAGDPATVERMRREQWLSDGWVSGCLQQVAATALSDRRARATIGRARVCYAERRVALLEALRRRGIAARGQSGLVVWVPVDDEGSVVSALAARGVWVRGGARYRLRSPPGVRLCVSMLDPARAERLADDVAAALHPAGRGPTP